MKSPFPQAFQHGYPQVIHIIPISEIRILLSWQPSDPSTITYRDSLVLHLQAGLGLRRAEVLSVRVENFSSPTGRTWLTFAGKGGHVRTLPVPFWLSSRFIDYFKFWQLDPENPAIRHFRHFVKLAGCPLTYATIHQITKNRTLEILGHPVRCHILRHSCASAWIAQGTDIKTVQLLLGHRSISTTSRYLHPGEDALTSAVDSLAGSPSPSLFYLTEKRA